MRGDDSMSGIKLGIVSQTPAVRFLRKVRGSVVHLRDLKRKDYMYTVGGVTPMVRAQLSELVKEKTVSKAEWFSLNANAPERIILNEHIEIENVFLRKENSQQYTNFKQELWNNIHGIDAKGFNIAEYLGYFRYNSRLAKAILQRSERFDIFEIHDFQQLLLGSMLGPAYPTMFRWHIPFVPDILNAKIKKFIINGMESNDAVVVSTKRDLEGLIRAGFDGRAYQVYPHIDPDAYPKSDAEELVRFEAKYSIPPGEFLIINVARMDNMKSQDDLIKAFSLIKNPKCKLMLIGNGSFTSQTLGHAKGNSWRAHLERLVARLGLSDRVIFTGYMPDEEVRVAYSRANLFVLPSRTEGFGLAAVEAWLYNVPSIVSAGAGVSELIIDGLNGETFAPGDFKSLAKKIGVFIKDPEFCKELGVNAHRTARVCFVKTAVPQLKSIYMKTLAEFE
jgi:glycosyltransferase involved in cell wall biosynthesis